MVSHKLISAVKLGSEPAYRIAQKANIGPSTLSQLICGIVKVKPQDPRVIAVGRVVGLSPEDCFEEQEKRI